MPQIESPSALVTPASASFPPNPQLHSPPKYLPETAAPSTVATGTTTFSEKKLRNSLLRRNQCCAVTRSATETIQSCHVLNAVRKKKHGTAEEARERKKALEDFLAGRMILGSQSSSFSLNSLANTLLLKPHIRGSWDKYASVMFCPPLETITRLTTYFLFSNCLWDAVVEYAIDRKTLPPRPFDLPSGFADECVLSSDFDFFVLHPSTFLPYGEPFSVCMNPPYLDEAHPTISYDHLPIWETYHYHAATSKLTAENAPATNAVQESTIDALKISMHGTSLSTVAVILNADTKIEHAQSHQWRLSSEVSALKKAIDSFKLAFYYLPTLRDSSSPPSVSAWQRISQSKSSISAARFAIGAVKSRRRFAGWLFKERVGDGRVTTAPRPSGRFDEGRPDEGSGSGRGGSRDNQPEEDAFEYEEEDEDEEEEDDEEASRSLSTQEIKLGLKQVVDPSIPIQQRMEVASLLLFKQHLPSPRGQP
ncbi:hypothetical protein B0H12DRAFT_1322719 [Mycena haematopus]|nr:hypothetical protein B0H12DRAFT_1322719 [Mycena haematopus]